MLLDGRSEATSTPIRRPHRPHVCTTLAADEAQAHLKLEECVVDMLDAYVRQHGDLHVSDKRASILIIQLAFTMQVHATCPFRDAARGTSSLPASAYEEH